MKRRCTLLVLSHKDFWQDEEGFKTTGGFGRQIQALSRHFEKTLLCVPVTQIGGSVSGYLVREGRIEFHPIAPLENSSTVARWLGLLVRTPSLFSYITTLIRQSDLVNVRLAGPFGLLTMMVSRVSGKPRFVWIGGDWVSCIILVRDSIMRRVAAMVIGCLLHLILRDELVFALAGVPTYSRRQHVVVSTVLSAGDIAMLAGRSFELHQPPRLLYVGRLTGGKGLEYLLEAVALLIARGQDVRCSLVGDGPLKERLQELTLKNGIEDRVSFDGYIPWGSELLAAYTRADVFVFPSLSEGQGKVLLEAQAAGLAIVASRAGGIPYIIRDGENGLLVPPGDSATLAEAIARLLSDHGLRRRCVEAGLVEVCDHTVERETHDMVEIVRQTYALA